MVAPATVTPMYNKDAQEGGKTPTQNYFTRNRYKGTAPTALLMIQVHSNDDTSLISASHCIMKRKFHNIEAILSMVQL